MRISRLSFRTLEDLEMQSLKSSGRWMLMATLAAIGFMILANMNEAQASHRSRHRDHFVHHEKSATVSHQVSVDCDTPVVEVAVCSCESCPHDSACSKTEKVVTRTRTRVEKASKGDRCCQQAACSSRSVSLNHHSNVNAVTKTTRKVSIIHRE